MNIAVFASHGGSDLQAIIDGCRDGRINATVKVVISNNRDSMALVRSNGEGIPNYHMSVKKYGSAGWILNTLLLYFSSIEICNIRIYPARKIISIEY